MPWHWSAGDRARDGSADQVGEGHVEGRGDADQGVEDRRLVALLDPVDRLPVHACAFGEEFLADPLRAAGGADVFADGPAVGDNPLGL